MSEWTKKERKVQKIVDEFIGEFAEATSKLEKNQINAEIAEIAWIIQELFPPEYRKVVLEEIGKRLNLESGGEKTRNKMYF